MNLFISIFKTLFQVGLGFLLLVIIAEIALQFLPVKTGFKRPQTIEEGVPPALETEPKFYLFGRVAHGQPAKRMD